MRRISIGISAWLAFVSAVVLARQDAGAPPPSTFRGGVDLVELDVSALDKDRHPVHGLTEGDFTVTIDGQPRKVVAFKAVDLPAPPPAPSAPWMRDVAPDVATNTHPSGRVIAIVIDDGSFAQRDAGSAWGMEKSLAAAKAVVDDLSPDDLAAVVYTENNHMAQAFTTDRQRLITAIDKSQIVPLSASSDPDPYSSDPLGILRGSCRCGLCSIEALSHVADSLRSLPQQRKIIVYISLGLPVEPHIDLPFKSLDSNQPPIRYRREWQNCNDQQHTAMIDVFRQAQLSNIAINSIDPEGLRVSSAIGTDNVVGFRREFVKTVAETTGGRAIVDHNDPEKDIPAMLSESSSYYLLGVERPPVKDDGAFHPIKVKVNRPGVDVRARNGYYAPTEKDLRKAETAPAAAGLEAAIADTIPKSDFPLAATIVPFTADGKKIELATILAIDQPNATPSVARVEPIDWIVRLIDPEQGVVVASARQRANITWNETSATSAKYELRSRMPAAPGRYEVRIGAHTADSHVSSVYTYVDVPDFAKAPLSVAGLVLSVTPTPKAAMGDAFADLMPNIPVAQRIFEQSDQVKALIRVFQGGTGALAPVKVTTHVTGSDNVSTDKETKTIDSAAFNEARWTDYAFDVPLTTPTGEYLLTVDVALGKNTVQRTLRFQVR